MSVTPAQMKQHDTAPALTLHITDGPPTYTGGALTNGVDLTTATAIRLLIKPGKSALLARTIADRPSDGVLTYAWVAEDTASAVTLRVEVEVTWPDASVQTYPVGAAAQVVVNADLG